MLFSAGQDPAGARGASITAPTLIADGAADQLDPAVNSRTLAGLISGARLTLFPAPGTPSCSRTRRRSSPK